MIVRNINSVNNGLGQPAEFAPNTALVNLVEWLNRQNQLAYEQGKIPEPLPIITPEEYAPYFYNPGQSSPDIDHPEWVPSNTIFIDTPQGLAPNPAYVGSELERKTAEAMTTVRVQTTQPSETQQAPTNVQQTTYSLSATIQNLGTGSASNFKVGDSWKVTIQGQPNKPVTAIGGKNGASHTTVMGTTNSNGVLVLTGTMSQAEIGHWYQQWKVGEQVAGVITFVVNDAPANTTPTNQQQQQNSTIEVDSGNFNADELIEQGKSILTNTTFGLPNWLIGAGGLFLAFKVFDK